MFSLTKMNPVLFAATSMMIERTMNNSDNDKTILEKIRKLLALSKSDNEYEAATALAAALRLATKYGLEMNQIEKEDTLEPVEHEDLFIRNQIGRWEILLFSGLADLFACEILTSRTLLAGYSWPQTRVIIVGRKTDRLLVAHLCTYLRSAIKKMYATKKVFLEARFLRNSAYKIREDYCYGAVLAVLEKAEEMFRKSVTEDELKASTSLILAKQAAVTKYIEDTFSLYEKRRKKVSFSRAISEGWQDGQDIEIRRPIEEQEKINKKYLFS